MGADFLKRRSKGYQKHIDRKRASLAAGDLLTQTPSGKPRRVIAKMRRGMSLRKGEKLIIEKRDGILTGSRGNCVVAEVEKATPVISNSVSGSSGVAIGTVEKVNVISNTVEVSICSMPNL